jgi:hypothetical protein
MCKNELFQSSGTKNEFFKVQGRKTKLMYSLRTKTIFWPKIKERKNNLLTPLTPEREREHTRQK